MIAERGTAELGAGTGTISKVGGWAGGLRGGLIRLYFMFLNISHSGFEQAGIEVGRQSFALAQVRGL